MILLDLPDSDLDELAEVIRASPIRTQALAIILRAVKQEIVRRAMSRGGQPYIHLLPEE